MATDENLLSSFTNIEIIRFNSCHSKNKKTAPTSIFKFWKYYGYAEVFLANSTIKEATNPVTCKPSSNLASGETKNW